MDTAHNQRKLSVLLLTLVLILVVGLSTVAETLVVSKDGAYSSVQNAIDAASSGDTVLVKEGTYEENLTVDKDLTLQGTGSARTKIDGAKKGHPVLLVGPSEVVVTIEKLTLRGAKGKCEDRNQGICPVGLSVTGGSSVSVSQSKITENDWSGLWLSGSAQASVEDSQFTGNDNGLELYGSAQASVKDCQITGNYYGLELSDSSQVSIKDCRITGNENDGLWLTGSSQASVKDCQITGNSLFGLRLSGSIQVSIKDSQITENEDGFRLSGSTQVSIKDSRITGNEYDGLELYDSAQTSVKDSSLRENGVGIKISKPDSFSGTISGYGNQISDNKTNFKGVSQKSQKRLLSQPDQE